MATRRKRDTEAGTATSSEEPQPVSTPKVRSPRSTPAADAVLANLSEMLGQMMSNCLDIQESMRLVQHGLHGATTELHEIREQAQTLKQELFLTRASLDVLHKTLHETRQDIQECFKDTGEKFLLVGQACRDLQQELREVRGEVEQMRSERRESPSIPPIPGPLEPTPSESALIVEVIPGPLPLEADVPPSQGKATLGVTVDPDATIIEVLPGTPAEKAGLQAGDVLVGVDGKSIASGAELREAIGQTDAGTEVRIQVARGQQIEELKAQLEDLGEAAVLHDTVA